MSEILKNGDQITIKPNVDVVASMAKKLKDELNAQVQESPKDLILDLSEVKMIDSVGIGVIIATHNTLNKTGGKLKVVNVGKDIYGLFTTMRLDRHFTVESA